MTIALPETFWAKVRPTDCLIWTGAVNTTGYGCWWDKGEVVLAHRAAYEAAYGPIPAGLVLDHKCRVRNCVNAEHLEAVTDAENIHRGLTARMGRLEVGGRCARGHDIAADADLYSRPSRPDVVECRACRSMKAHRRNRLACT